MFTLRSFVLGGLQISIFCGSDSVLCCDAFTRYAVIHRHVVPELLQPRSETVASSNPEGEWLWYRLTKVLLSHMHCPELHPVWNRTSMILEALRIAELAMVSAGVDSFPSL